MSAAVSVKFLPRLYSDVYMILDVFSQVLSVSYDYLKVILTFIWEVWLIKFLHLDTLINRSIPALFDNIHATYNKIHCNGMSIE